MKSSFTLTVAIATPLREGEEGGDSTRSDARGVGGGEDALARSGDARRGRG